MNVLHRETAQLLTVSRKRMLSPSQSARLNSYARLVKELRKDESKELDGLSDEELERVAAGKKKR